MTRANDTVTTTPGAAHTVCRNWVESKRTVVSCVKQIAGVVDVPAAELVIVALGSDSCALVCPDPEDKVGRAAQP